MQIKQEVVLAAHELCSYNLLPLLSPRGCFTLHFCFQHKAWSMSWLQSKIKKYINFKGKHNLKEKYSILIVCDISDLFIYRDEVARLWVMLLHYHHHAIILVKDQHHNCPITLLWCHNIAMWGGGKEKKKVTAYIKLSLITNGKHFKCSL